MQASKRQIYLRPPVSYYGGKQSLLNEILPRVPLHTRYVEPFLGGGAVFWAKSPSTVEVINDHDGFVTSFYEVVKSDLSTLKAVIEARLFSRQAHDHALVIRQHQELFDPINRAWAFFYLANTSLYSQLDNSMRTPQNDKNVIHTFNRKVDALCDAHAERLKSVFVECREALYIIEKNDGPDTFFFVDPPYFQANMGHYAGYTFDDFQRLLSALSTIQGKFLLTCYPGQLVEDYAHRYGWVAFYKEMHLAAGGKGKRKIECMFMNY